MKTLAFFGCLAVAYCLLGQVVAAMRTVCEQGCAYRTVEAALAASQPSDTIAVKAGNYACNRPILVKMPVVILGQGYPAFDFQHQSAGFVVSAPDVVIEGLYILHIRQSSMEDLAGIRVENAARFTARNNRLTDTFFGIYLANSDHALIEGNVLEGRAQLERNAGNGIHLWKCAHANIRENKVNTHRDGIYFEFVTDSYIRDNRCENNIRYGLHFMFSHNDRYEHNTFRRNAAGVAVMYSKQVIMSHNQFLDNWGDASYGLLLKELTDGEIRFNTFTQNTVALLMEGSSRMTIEHNRFERNGWAVRATSSGQQNIFKNNVLLSNSFDVATNGEAMSSDFDGNYWDHYQGYDLNRDGVGDVPFHPVSLYSVVVEQMPAALMLYRSFLVDLLNSTERVIPLITPEAFVDRTPLMSPPLSGSAVVMSHQP